MSGILGKKIGMTSLFDDAGESIPCTISEAGPCYVTQVKTKERDGYDAVQLGFDPKPERLVSKPLKGQFVRANVKPVRFMLEFRSSNGLPKDLGAEVRVELFQQGDVVHVTGKSKGRGFQGVVKRHHFGGVGMTTHGASDRVRAPGSIGASSFPSRVMKGMRMAGRMGHTQVTVRNLRVVKVIPESNILILKGSIPGAINSYVQIVKES
ncbi:MAG: 50S ribosomal protein L3 [Bacteroidota bacterium]